MVRQRIALLWPRCGSVSRVDARNVCDRGKLHRGRHIMFSEHVSWPRDESALLATIERNRQAIDTRNRAVVLARELPHRPERVEKSLTCAAAAGWDMAEAERLVRDGQRSVGDGLAVLDSAVLARRLK